MTEQVSKVIAHIAGPSGSGKTELVNVLTPLVDNINLVDLDIFDDQVEDLTDLKNADKNDYTNAQLYDHHCIKQSLINSFISSNELPIIFFGHIEEAGNIIELPSEVVKLLLTNSLQGAVRRAKHLSLTLEEFVALARQGESDVVFFKNRGYIPVTSRKVYRKVLDWSKTRRITMTEQGASSPIIPLSNANFEEEVLKADLPVLVCYGAPWCGPYTTMVPALDELAEEFPDKVKICTLDIESYPDVAKQYGIKGIPSVQLFKVGQVFGGRLGASTKSQIAGFLDSTL